jgi:hypothetical protein
MNFCPDCGTQLSETDNFCGNCGTQNGLPKVDLVQKYGGVGVYAFLCLCLLPVAGFILVIIIVSNLLSLIFHLNPKLVGDLTESPTFAIPIALGLAIGLYLNRKNVFLVDLFAWLLPAIWFICYFFIEGPRRFARLFSPPRPDCDECLLNDMFTIPLIFSAAYSIAALCQKLRLRAGKSFKTLS